MTSSIEVYSPQWWDARKAILAGIATQSRKRGVKYTEAQTKRSDAAMQCALGEEDGRIAYERNGFTREQWLKKHFPQALEGVVDPAERVRLLRNAMRDL